MHVHLLDEQVYECQSNIRMHGASCIKDYETVAYYMYIYMYIR